MKNRKFLPRKGNESSPTILIEGAVTPLSGSSDVIPLKVTEEGELWTTGSISIKLNGSDIQIGAVELKDGTTDNRAIITSGSLMVSESNSIYRRYTEPTSLVSAQDLTETYADFGSEIDMTGFNRLGIFLRADTNQSLYGYLKVLGKTVSGSAYEYDIDGVDIKTLWEGSGSDFNKYYEFDVGTIPWIQLQAKTTTSGSVAGNLTIDINKKWRD